MKLERYTAEKPFAQKHLLCLQDYSKDEIRQVLSLAIDIKAKQKAGIPHPLLAGKTLGMIFSKSSTRTRVSFEVGIFQLGGMGLFLNSSDIQLGRGESIRDTAEVLSRMVDGIMIRTFSHYDVVELARYSHVPIINGLTDHFHPCQALGDLLTIYEKRGTLDGLKLAYIGDGNNVCHSLMVACTRLGMNVSVAHPDGFAPERLVWEFATMNVQREGRELYVGTDPSEAVKGADVVYTDVWASMGQESEAEERKEKFSGYQVNSELMAKANPGALFMHCLPAHVGDEVSEDVMYGPNSIVYDEAENRLHAQKAVMAMLMK